MMLFCLQQCPYKHLTKSIVALRLSIWSNEILEQLGFATAPYCLCLHGSSSPHAFLNSVQEEYNVQSDYLAYLSPFSSYLIIINQYFLYSDQPIQQSYQLTIRNIYPISTTYPISIPSTQLSIPICSHTLIFQGFPQI